MATIRCLGDLITFFVIIELHASLLDLICDTNLGEIAIAISGFGFFQLLEAKSYWFYTVKIPTMQSENYHM